jgi:16S rRNA pseudouridine516 synthase
MPRFSIKYNAQKAMTEVQQLMWAPRLQSLSKILRDNGYCDRVKARRFLKQVPVEYLQPGGTAIRVRSSIKRVDPDRLLVDGNPIPEAKGPLHLVLHKPAGYACTHATSDGPTVYDLFPDCFRFRKPKLATIGRLDKMATGLILLTQTGRWCQRLTFNHTI